MNVDVYKPESNLLDQIEIKRVIISALVMLFVTFQYFIVNNGGSTSSWGAPFSMNLYFITIPNTLYFFLFIMLGNFVILLTAFPILQTETGIINNKILQLIGLLLFLFGIEGYFNFLFWEPFLLLYLSIIAIIYFTLSSFSFSFMGLNFQTPFFSQTDYTGYTQINNLSVWTSNTKNVLMAYYTHQILQIALLLIIALFFVQLILVSTNKGKLISDINAEKLSSFSRTNLAVGNTLNNRIKILGIFILFQYILFAILLVDYQFYLSFLLLIVFTAYFKRNIIRTTVFKLGFYNIKIYDLYALNFIFMALLSEALGWITDNMFYLVVFIFSLWLAIKIIEFVKNLRADSTLDEINEVLINIAPNDVLKTIYLGIVVLYISAWFSAIDEELYLTLLLLATLIYFAPFLIRNFFNGGVIKYAIRRMFLIIPMFIGISVIVFLIMSLAGNPVDLILSGVNCNHVVACIASKRKFLNDYYGFNKPMQIQWFNWFFHFLQGDFGLELSVGTQPVVADILAKAGPTMEISFIPIILSLLISIPLGIMASKKQNSLTDTIILIFVSIGIAVPIFFFIIVLILTFSVNLQMLPPSGRALVGLGAGQVSYLYTQWFAHGIPIDYSLVFQGHTFFAINTIIPINQVLDFVKWDWIFHMIIPVICITILSLATYTRLVRAGMLEVMRNDYILSARASGFSEKVIINKYALRNVLLPVLTFVGLSIGFTLAGAPITETVLRWPGLGYYSIQAVLLFDYNAIMATSMVVAIMILFANLITDIMYSVVDPRIRLD